MSANRMFMLEFGCEFVHKSLSVLGGGDHIIATPIFGAPVETSDGLVLLDTGISGTALADRYALTEIYGEGLEAVGPPGEPLEVALAQGTERGAAFYRSDYVGPQIDWRTIDGDEQIAPGVYAFSTPGHTPGHMSYRVDLPETGTWLLAADAADLGENLLERIPCGSTTELDARVIPGHDSVFWKAIWHPPGGHR